MIRGVPDVGDVQRRATVLAGHGQPRLVEMSGAPRAREDAFSSMSNGSFDRCAAIGETNRDEWAVLAGALAMKRLRERALSGPILPLHEQAYVARSHGADRARQGTYRRTCASDQRRAVGAVVSDTRTLH
jgi:hypothetical protein